MTSPAHPSDAMAVLPAWQPVPIGVAPNGARRMPTDHEALPITPTQLALCARQCVEAGATWFHVHVRDDQGAHSLDPGRYREAFAAIHEAVGEALVLQMTTEAVGRYTPAQQMAAVRALQPQAVSLAVRELFADEAGLADALAFWHELREAGTAMQFIVYDTDDLRRLVALHQRPGGFQGCPEVLMVLGSYASRKAGHPRDLLPLLGQLPASWRWSACAFGASELACLVACASLGGGVRVGFENNVWRPDGQPAQDNAELVRQVAGTLDALGIPRASAAVTRERFFGAPALQAQR